MHTPRKSDFFLATTPPEARTFVSKRGVPVLTPVPYADVRGKF
jgi:hypothetical protein